MSSNRTPEDRVMDDTDLMLSSDVVGSLYWSAIHRVSTVTELVCLSRMFPCCRCRGNFLLKEATLHGRSHPLSYDEAIVFWSSLLLSEAHGNDIESVAYTLHCIVNTALGRNSSYPSLSVVKSRTALSPLTPDTILHVLISAVSSLCKSGCDYDARAREYCSSDNASLDMLCQSQALIYEDRASVLKSYIMFWREKLSVDDRSSWRHVSRVVHGVNIEAIGVDFVSSCTHVLAEVLSRDRNRDSHVLVRYLCERP